MWANYKKGSSPTRHARVACPRRVGNFVCVNFVGVAPLQQHMAIVTKLGIIVNNTDKLSE